MKEGKYAKPLAKIQVTAIFLKQGIQRNVLNKIYRYLHEDAMRKPIRMCVSMVFDSSVVYHKTRDTFSAKIYANTTFQLLLFIMKVKSH